MNFQCAFFILMLNVNCVYMPPLKSCTSKFPFRVGGNSVGISVGNSFGKWLQKMRVCQVNLRAQVTATSRSYNRMANAKCACGKKEAWRFNVAGPLRVEKHGTLEKHLKYYFRHGLGWDGRALPGRVDFACVGSAEMGGPC